MDQSFGSGVIDQSQVSYIRVSGQGSQIRVRVHIYQTVGSGVIDQSQGSYIQVSGQGS